MDFSDHPNGKCTIIPVMNPNEKPDWETGKEWFQKLDPEEQKRLMGKTRFDLWQEGQIGDLRQFVFNKENKVWGNSPTQLRLNLLPVYDCIGQTAADGTLINGFTNHFLSRLTERNTSLYGFFEAISNPDKIEDRSRPGSPAVSLIGRHTIVRLNPETGYLITIMGEHE